MAVTVGFMELLNTGAGKEVGHDPLNCITVYCGYGRVQMFYTESVLLRGKYPRCDIIPPLRGQCDRNGDHMMLYTLDQVRESMVHAWDGIESLSASAMIKHFSPMRGEEDRPRFLEPADAGRLAECAASLVAGA